jgi:hypothetical protein
MNSNLDSYLAEVVDNNTAALRDGKVSLARSLPGFVCRELEVINNKFVDSSDPFMTSYRALRRIQRIARPPIPRKIEFESVVYLKEGVIDCIFPNSQVTLFLIGDTNGDKRFSYNCYRLFKTFGSRYRIHSFICNPDLIGARFGRDEEVQPGWSETRYGDRLYYHATEWAELDEFLQLISEERGKGQVLVVVDVDGTYLCPRPSYYSRIDEARKEAIIAVCGDIFERSTFDPHSEEQVEKLKMSYHDASRTTFSKAYEDQDLTMLIALGLYAGIIDKNDTLLNPTGNIGFTVPIEWLEFASFLIDNNPEWEYPLRQLRALYTRCADTIKDGSPSAFVEFRRKEERILASWAADGKAKLNRNVTQFIRDCARERAVTIAFTDYPNASLGLYSTSSPAYTATALPDAFINIPLDLVD